MSEFFFGIMVGMIATVVMLAFTALVLISFAENCASFMSVIMAV